MAQLRGEQILRPSTFSGSFTGVFAGDGASITGVVSSSYATTSSYATQASSSLIATSASYASMSLSSSFATTSSFSVSSSYAAVALTVLNPVTVDLSAYITTASFNPFTASVNLLNAATSSYVLTSATSSMTVLSSSYALTASYAINIPIIDTSALVGTASFNAFTSSIQTEVNNLTLATSSYVLTSVTSSMIVSGALTASYYQETDPIFTAASGGFTTTGSFNSFTSSIQTEVNSLTLATSSYVLTSVTQSMLQPYVLTSVTSSMLQPYVLTTSTSSMIVSGALTASYYQETDPIFVSKSGSFATTGSNTFKDSQTISGSVYVSGSIDFNNGSRIVSNLFGDPNSIDIVAGLSSYAELTSNNTQSFVWVANNGAYVGTNWDTTPFQWEFGSDGYLRIPQVQSISQQAGILTVGDIILQADQAQSWRFSSGSGTLYTPGPIESPSFTGSLMGTASWAYSASQAISSSYAATASYISTLYSSNFTASFASSTTWTINHSLNTRYVIVQTFDSNHQQLIPQEITLTNTNTATATFSSPEAGYAVVTVGGSLFTAQQTPAGNASTIQYNNGGIFGGDDKLYFDGSTFAVDDPSNQPFIHSGDRAIFSPGGFFALNAGSDYESITQTDISKTFSDLEERTAVYTLTGDRFFNKLWKTPQANQWDIVYLNNSAPDWSTVIQSGSNSAFATKMLGLFTGEDILTEGYVTVEDNTNHFGLPMVDGTLEYGAPVYLRQQDDGTAPHMSTTVPTGGIVRILGHLMYQNSGDGRLWFMRFRPDHTWVEI
jgi:hypothetical protein